MDLSERSQEIYKMKPQSGKQVSQWKFEQANTSVLSLTVSVCNANIRVAEKRFHFPLKVPRRGSCELLTLATQTSPDTRHSMTFHNYRAPARKKEETRWCLQPGMTRAKPRHAARFCTHGRMLFLSSSVQPRPKMNMPAESRELGAGEVSEYLNNPSKHFKR